MSNKYIDIDLLKAKLATYKVGDLVKINTITNTNKLYNNNAVIVFTNDIFFIISVENSKQIIRINYTNFIDNEFNIADINKISDKKPNISISTNIDISDTINISDTIDIGIDKTVRELGIWERDWSDSEIIDSIIENLHDVF